MEVPKFYAVLYDTVATGQQNILQLQLPKSVEYLVHFVAIDEPRNILFTPTIDVESGQKIPDPLEQLIHPFLPDRINVVYLPGAHSDIGASYQEGIGDLYITLTEQLLYMMGLTNSNCWETTKDPSLGGKHDSRGLLDKLFGRPDPDSVLSINRPRIPVATVELSNDERSEMMSRLDKLTLANFERQSGMSTTISEMSPSFSFVVERAGDNIKPIEASNEINPASMKFVKYGQIPALEFRYSDALGGIQSNLPITDQVMQHIHQGSRSTISRSYFQDGNSFFLVTFVDGIIAEKIPAERMGTTVLFQKQDHCIKRPDGTLKDPLQIRVFHNNTQ